MERVRLLKPSSEPVFITTLKVQVGDLNYGNHVGNDRILLYCHELRKQYLYSIGQSELKFFNSSLIMSDSTCIYKSQAFWNDEILCELFIEEITDTALRFFYKLSNKSTTVEIALARTTMVFFNYDLKKVVRMNSKNFQL